MASRERTLGTIGGGTGLALRVWLRGVVPVLETPFDEEGRVDPVSFAGVVASACNHGVRAVMFPGFASEHWKLSDEEKDGLVGLARRVTAEHGVRFIASVNDEATYLAARRAARYQALGADALNLLPPRVSKPSRDEALRHLESVAGAVPDLPLIVQYVPAEGGVRLEPEEFAALAASCANVGAVKVEEQPAAPYVAALRALALPLAALVGNGGTEMLAALEAGAAGVQPGGGFIGVYTEIWRRWERGDSDEARELFLRLVPYLVRWINAGRLTAVGKVIAWRTGVLASPHCRQPTPALDGHNRSEIDRFIAEMAPYLDGAGVGSDNTEGGRGER